LENSLKQAFLVHYFPLIHGYATGVFSLRKNTSQIFHYINFCKKSGGDLFRSQLTQGINFPFSQYGQRFSLLPNRRF